MADEENKRNDDDDSNLSRSDKFALVEKKLNREIDRKFLVFKVLTIALAILSVC